jgi:aromatic ring-opening dioxygenase catalytic subunit (LigB family)
LKIVALASTAVSRQESITFMNEKTSEGADSVTRRRAILTGISGAAVAAGIASMQGGESTATAEAAPKRTSKSARQPVVFLPHGGGPWPFVDTGFAPKAELDQLADYLRSVRDVPASKPRALVVVSAHWEEPEPTVMSGTAPPLFFDYYGFPPESYRLTWPAPGHPEVAARVRELLGGAGFSTAENKERGFDHGTFVPLKLTYPEADMPTVQLSLKRGLDPAEHLAMGRALAPLRDEGVFIVGSGMTFHNLRAFMSPASRPVAESFDAWLREAATSDPQVRDQKLTDWARAPSARAAHPREEHLLPLMVVAGAAGADRGTVGFGGTFAGLRLSAYHYG